MIKKIKIEGYRVHRKLIVVPNPRFNLVVGANESGKSTFLEAVTLALTGRINGRSASEELNPHWFNAELVQEFVHDRTNGKPVGFPTIRIELFFDDIPELQRLCGAHGSDIPAVACPGVIMQICPNPEYAADLEEWAKAPTKLLPVEYYKCDWRSFADYTLTARPKELPQRL